MRNCHNRNNYFFKILNIDIYELYFSAIESAVMNRSSWSCFNEGYSLKLHLQSLFILNFTFLIKTFSSIIPLSLCTWLPTKHETSETIVRIYH